MASETIRLTQFSHGAGCGCKIAPAVLEQILQSTLPGSSDQRLLVGNSSKDDAAVYDLPNVEYYIATTGDGLKAVGDTYQAEDYGIAISKGNDELVAAINDALATLHENGTYDEIYDKWFGASE